MCVLVSTINDFSKRAVKAPSISRETARNTSNYRPEQKKEQINNAVKKDALRILLNRELKYKQTLEYTL